MQLALTIAHWLVRITGVLLLILGLLIWTESAFTLIGIHMLLGLVLVVSMWVFALAAIRLGGPPGLAAGVAILGIIVLWFGLRQTEFLPRPDPNHWIVQVVHLLLGMAAVGIAEALGGRLRRARLARAST